MPTGVKIISIVYYLCAVLLVIAGISMIAGFATLGAFLMGKIESEVLAAIGATVGTFIAIVMIAFAVLSYFIGKGLWHGKNWARITAIVLAGLGVLNGLTTLLVGGFVWLVVNAAILWYLGFTKEGKAAFS